MMALLATAETLSRSLARGAGLCYFGTNITSATKKPRNAFVMFMMEERSQITGNHSSQQLMSVMAEKWRNMDPAEKLEYKEKARLASQQWADVPADLKLEWKNRRLERAVSKVKKQIKTLEADKPKRNPSSYALFVAEMYPTFDKLPASERMKSIGQAWQNLTEAQKQQFQHRAEQQRAAYIQQLNCWKTAADTAPHIDQIRSARKRLKDLLSKLQAKPE